MAVNVRKDRPRATVEEMGDFTENTRVLISFGASEGGFDYSLGLRWAIYQKFNRQPQSDPAFVYIDAVSLESATGTAYNYSREYDTHHMSNPTWDGFYQAAMRQCKTMIFLISSHWLRSYWCWKELGWFMSGMKTCSVKPVFVLFPDAHSVLLQQSLMTKQGKRVRPAEQWRDILLSRAKIIHIRTVASSEVRNATFHKIGPNQKHEPSMGTLAFHYATSEAETTEIINSIVV